MMGPILAAAGVAALEQEMRSVATERVQRRIDRLLDEAERAMDARDWEVAGSLAREALDLDT